MTSTSYGAKTRRPVYSGTRRIPGLYERRLASGEVVYDVALRLGGQVRRLRLTAATKTDAVAELRALQVDYGRGETFRSPALALTVADLAADWMRHLTARIGDRDARRRYSARTVALYRQRLEQHIVPALGHRPVADVTLADVRRLVERLGAAGLAPSTVTGTLGILSGLLRYAVKGGLLERNPVRDLDRDDRPGVGRLSEPRYLTADELGRLLGGWGTRSGRLPPTCTFAALRGQRGARPPLAGHRSEGGHADRLRRSSGPQASASGQDPRGERRDGAAPAGARRRAPRAPARVAAQGLRSLHRRLARVHDVAREASVRPQRAARGPRSRRGGRAEWRRPRACRPARPPPLFVALALAPASLPEASSLARHANARITAMAYAGLTDDDRAKLAGKLAAAFEGGLGR